MIYARRPPVVHVLALAAVVATTTTNIIPFVDAVNNITHDRRKCNSIVGTATKTEIETLATSLVDAFFPPGSGGSANLYGREILKTIAQHDVVAKKICSSCEEIRELYNGDDESLMGDGGDGPDTFGSYCGTLSSNATVSGLVVYPIDPVTKELVVGKLRGAIFNRQEKSSTFNVPSEKWPANIFDMFGPSTLNATERVNYLFTEFYDVVSAFAAASKGAVCIIPDYLGYGESYDVPKSFLVKQSYQQSAIPLWFYAKNMLTNASDSCTILDDDVTVAGYSEGGYATIAIAEAMTKLNVSTGLVFAGGGPYRLSSVQLLNTIETANGGTFPSTERAAVALQGYAYSSTNPNLPNTNVEPKQDLLLSSYVDNVTAWLGGNGLSWTELNELMPMNPIDVWDVDFRVEMELAIDQNIKDPCVTDIVDGVTDKLCESLIENDLSTILENATYTINLCHSPNDTYVPITNLPSSSTAQANNPNNLILYTGIQGFELLEPRGTHTETSRACLFGVLLNFALNPQYSEIKSLTDDKVRCVPSPTSTPTETPGGPTSAPSDSPTNTEIDKKTNGDTSSAPRRGLAGGVVEVVSNWWMLPFVLSSSMLLFALVQPW